MTAAVRAAAVAARHAISIIARNERRNSVSASIKVVKMKYQRGNATSV